MDDAEYERQKQRLLDLSARWIKPLGLGWWDIELAYARDDYEPPSDNGSGHRSLAYCSCDWRYGHATITWNMPEVRDCRSEKLERAFVHELNHILVNEMRWARPDDADHLDHEERVVSTLTKAFLWLRDSLTEQAAPDPISTEVSTC